MIRRSTFLRLVLASILLAIVAGPATTSLAGTQDFIVVNRTGVEIAELYVSASATDNWEEDILGVDTLPDGQSVRISFKGHDACKWDLMIKDEEGESIEWTGLNLCKISKVTLRWNGKKAWAEVE